MGCGRVGTGPEAGRGRAPRRQRLPGGAEVYATVPVSPAVGTPGVAVADPGPVLTAPRLRSDAPADTGSGHSAGARSRFRRSSTAIFRRSAALLRAIAASRTAPARVRAARKPNSVPRTGCPERGGGHVSTPTVARRMMSDLPGDSPGGVDASLFGLAPCGVYRAPDITARAVRSYRTFSPLPLRERRGGLFSVALSFRSPGLGVTQRTALRSSDFPPAPRREPATV